MLDAAARQRLRMLPWWTGVAKVSSNDCPSCCSQPARTPSYVPATITKDGSDDIMIDGLTVAVRVVRIICRWCTLHFHTVAVFVWDRKKRKKKLYGRESRRLSATRLTFLIHQNVLSAELWAMIPCSQRSTVGTYSTADIIHAIGPPSQDETSVHVESDLHSRTISFSHEPRPLLGKLPTFVFVEFFLLINSHAFCCS